jgi:nucleotide-binding universal stress UspA family protein
MFPPKKILFPVDFSHRCSAVVPAVEAFARRFESEVTLIHVENPVRLEGSTYPPDSTDSTEARLAKFASRDEFKGLAVRTRIVAGDPASEIVDFAHDQKSDLIVMPTHGYGPFRRFLLGSVTLKVLHDAWCPVWTDAHTELLPSKQARFRSIVCALDLTPKSHPALQWAWQFAKANDAKILLVHAVPLLASYGAEYVQPEWQQQVADAASKQLDCLQRSEHTSAPVEIILGDVGGAVRAAVEAEKADLLVIGRSVDDRPLGRLRTHAYPIIRNSPCPVVSV